MGSTDHITIWTTNSMTKAQLKLALQARGQAVPTSWNKAKLVETLNEWIETVGEAEVVEEAVENLAEALESAAEAEAADERADAQEAATDAAAELGVVLAETAPEGAEDSEAADTEDDETEGEEEVTPRNVVKPHYRILYKERGNPNHCGDWLAQELDGVFTGEGNKFDIVAFTKCLQDNGVEFSGKWAELPNSGQKGWQGRYRMNGRQKLERQVLSTGKLVIDGEAELAPVDWLTWMATKLPAVDCQWFFGDDGSVVYPEAEAEQADAS